MDVASISSVTPRVFANAFSIFAHVTVPVAPTVAAVVPVVFAFMLVIVYSTVTESTDLIDFRVIVAITSLAFTVLAELGRKVKNETSAPNPAFRLSASTPDNVKHFSSFPCASTNFKFPTISSISISEVAVNFSFTSCPLSSDNFLSSVLLSAVNFKTLSGVGTTVVWLPPAAFVTVVWLKANGIIITSDNATATIFFPLFFIILFLTLYNLLPWKRILMFLSFISDTRMLLLT